VSSHVAGRDSLTTRGAAAFSRDSRIASQKEYLVSCANSRLSDLAAAADSAASGGWAPSVSLRRHRERPSVLEAAEQTGGLGGAPRRRRPTFHGVRHVHRHLAAARSRRDRYLASNLELKGRHGFNRCGVA